MKIGIFTQPLHNNYGGLLQNYALQQYLINNGHDVNTIDVNFYKPKLFGIKIILKNIYYKFRSQNKIISILQDTVHWKRKISINTSRFIDKNISLDTRVHSMMDITNLRTSDYDAFIVGSDQVWRPSYSPHIYTYFLDFLGENKSIIRVAYAASFGLDNSNEFTDEQLKKCSALLKNFNAIGVREDTAVNICHSDFNAKATHVIDPTLLLSKVDYIKVIEQESLPAFDGSMMVYVLDKNKEKIDIIDKVSARLSLTPYSVMKSDLTGIYPSVAMWLKGFADAKYVVTDSFHGVAFSILFNKPFIAIGNQGRGLARFESILNKFKLRNRLILSLDELTDDLINEEIDFTVINKILASERELTNEFFSKCLG